MFGSDRIGSERPRRPQRPGKALACIELPKLTRATLEAWRKRIADTPVIVNPHSDPKAYPKLTRKLIHDDKVAAIFGWLQREVRSL